MVYHYAGEGRVQVSEGPKSTFAPHCRPSLLYIGLRHQTSVTVLKFLDLSPKQIQSYRMMRVTMDCTTLGPCARCVSSTRGGLFCSAACPSTSRGRGSLLSIDCEKRWDAKEVGSIQSVDVVDGRLGRWAPFPATAAPLRDLQCRQMPPLWIYHCGIVWLS